MNMQEFLIPMTDTRVDIKENEIFELSPELLNALLKDHTLSTDTEQVNIFLATDNYAEQINIESITGPNGNIIVPWAVKSREQQRRHRMAQECGGN